MRVKAVSQMYYDRRMIAPGETYDMDDREAGEAKILAALGKIEIVGDEAKPKPNPEPQPEPQAPTYSTAAISPEPDKPSESEPPAQKRYYRRRDLRAEE